MGPKELRKVESKRVLSKFLRKLLQSSTILDACGWQDCGWSIGDLDYQPMVEWLLS